MNKHKAFSILELLITMSIAALLATSCYIGYAEYIVRAQISEGFRVLEEYKVIAAGLRAKTGTIAPYYVLFTDADSTGLISGTTNGTSAVKTVGLKYVNTVSADSGTDGSGNTYILLGAGLNNTSRIVSGADHVYVAGIQTANGLFTWKCGSSVSKANTVASDYLSQECQDSLP